MFPSFNTTRGAAPSLRFYSWRGRFMHDHDERGGGLDGFEGGQQGGPLLMHEDVGDGSAGGLVLSPLDNFMSGMLSGVSSCALLPRANSCTIEDNTDYRGNDLVMHKNVTSVGECCDLCKANAACTAFSWADQRDPTYEFDCWLKDSTAGRTAEKHTSGYLCDDTGKAGLLAAGVQGQVQSVPPGFTQSFVVAGRAGMGLTEALQAWGGALLSKHPSHPSNFTLMTRHLGYATDNGGYFYGGNVPTAENLTVTVRTLRQAGVNVTSLQLDPFWYPDGDALTGNCAVKWEARPDLFPNGLKSFRDAIGAPLVLYSSLWCTDTAKQPEYAGFKFVNSTDFNAGFDQGVFAQADPSTAEAFYNAIMDKQADVMGGFETDFMDFSALLVPDFVTTVDAAQGWLAGMWNAAAGHGVPSQQCMSLPSMILASLDFPSVTNARASEDDFPTNPHRWRIGYTAAMLGPLTIMPFFDVLWTSAVQPGNPYGLKHRFNVRRDVQVATLSQGPVWIGDGPGMTNATVVASFARADGVLIQPSYPATPIDAMYTSAGGPGEAAEVWSTYTTGPGFEASHIVFAVDVAEPFALPLSSLWPRPRTAGGGAPLGRFAVNDTAVCASGMPAALCTTYVPAGESHLTLVTGGQQPSGEHSTAVITLAREAAPGLAFLGLQGPVVRLSPQRVAAVTTPRPGELVASLTGVEGEVLEAWFVVPGRAPGDGPVVQVRSGTVRPDGTLALSSAGAA